MLSAPCRMASVFNNRVTMPLYHRTGAETNTSLSASTVDAAATETSDSTNISPLVVYVVIIASSLCLRHVSAIVFLRVSELKTLLTTKAPKTLATAKRRQ